MIIARLIELEMFTFSSMLMFDCITPHKIPHQIKRTSSSDRKLRIAFSVHTLMEAVFKLMKAPPEDKPQLSLRTQEKRYGNKQKEGNRKDNRPDRQTRARFKFIEGSRRRDGRKHSFKATVRRRES
jgi:hypothetical protein